MRKSDEMLGTVHTHTHTHTHNTFTKRTIGKIGELQYGIKEKNGITLIALIVTIIILLILAGITISAITGSGLFGQAKKAREKAKIAEYKEAIELAKTDAIIDKKYTNPEQEKGILEIIRDILSPQKLFEGSNFDITGNVLTITTSEGYIFTVTEDENGNIVISQINPDPNNPDSIDPGSDNDKPTSQYPLLVDQVNIGDYIEYDATNDYIYISYTGTGTTGGNGYEKAASQTFASSSSIKWRVLSKNTETGEIVIISEKPILSDEGEEFYMQGAIGYLYAEEELNKICEIYGHGKGADTSKVFTYEVGDIVEGVEQRTITGSGARSINVDDINKITGVTPSTDLDSSYGTPYSHSIYYPTRTTEKGDSTSATSRTDNYTYYAYDGSDYLDSTTATYNMLFRNITDSDYISYWLASRCIESYSSNKCYFNQRLLYKGFVDESYLTYAFDSEIGDYLDCYSIRPIVYLKENLETNGRNEDNEWVIIDNDDTSDSSPTEPALIEFEYEPSKDIWTNENVTVTATTTIEDYTLQTSKDGTNWENTKSQTFTAKGVIYARLYDGVNNKGSASANVTNIDKRVPTIGSAAINSTGTIIVNNIEDTGGSGLKGIYISTSSETPTATSVTWTANTSNNYSTTVNEVETYYIWVLDNAGNVSEAMCTLFASQISVGDYVAYDATNNYSYTSYSGSGTSGGNGSGSSQTFKSSSSIKWRVLSKDTETGEVVLISEAPLLSNKNSKFEMEGAIGYLYAEEELNKICAIYGHGKGADTSKVFTYEVGDIVEGVEQRKITGSGARSINADDIDKIVGVTPSKVNSDYGKSDTGIIYYPTRSRSSGYSSTTASRTDTNTSYSYAGSTYLDSASDIYKLLFRNKTNSGDIDYWLATRAVYIPFSNPATYRAFRVGEVQQQTKYGGNELFTSTVSVYKTSYAYHGVRPIVYLKSTVQTSGQDSSGAWTVIDN